MSPERSVTGRRTRLAPKPITGFGHSVDEDESGTAESGTANSAGTGQMPDTSLPADPDPRHEPEPARHTLQTAPAAAPPASSSPQEPSTTAPHTKTREPLAARALVDAARTSARDRPREWEAFTARLPPDLARRLTLRVAEDKRATKDYGLAAAHYLSAALSQVPTNLEQAAQWGLDWRARTTIVRTTTIGSGSRLHRDVASAMHELGSWLRTLDVRPNMWEVMAEALARLLDALDNSPTSIAAANSADRADL